MGNDDSAERNDWEYKNSKAAKLPTIPFWSMLATPYVVADIAAQTEEEE